MWGGRSVTKIICVFCGNGMRWVGLDGSPTRELMGLQEEVMAAGRGAQMSWKNPRRFIKYLPCPRCSEAAGQLRAARKSNANRAPARRTEHRCAPMIHPAFRGSL